MATDSPGKNAVAEFGLARTMLAQENTEQAWFHFKIADRMSKLGQNTNIMPWVENGLAVIATLNTNYGVAEKHYQQALLLSNDDPGIVANFVRMLHASGNIDDAKRIYEQWGDRFWDDNDAHELNKLIKGDRQTELNHSTQMESKKPPVNQQPALVLKNLTKRVTPTRNEAEQPILTVNLGQSKQINLDHAVATVLVVSPEIADVRLISPQRLYIVGKGVGRTSVSLIGQNGRVKEWMVSVGVDLRPLRGFIANEPKYQNVSVQQLFRSVILKGEVSSPAMAEQIFRLAQGALPEKTRINNELRVIGPQQVNLEVQIAEVQRSITERLGINWDIFTNFGSPETGLKVGFKIGQLLRRNIEGALSHSLSIAGAGDSASAKGLVDALARSGLANVLARPNVTAASGETASFFSGGEYPLPSAIENGVIVFKYKKYGVLLDFIPTIVHDNRIVLKVRPEVSEASLNDSIQIAPGIRVPIINVRRAETTVEVADGESIVIAGLFRNASNSEEEGIPRIKDIPLLGSFFGSTAVESEELELLVTVTARLVRPTSLSEVQQTTARRPKPKLKTYRY